jgi:hypothetical protein
MKVETRDALPGWYEMHFASPLDMLETRPSVSNAKQSTHNAAVGGSHWTKCDNYAAFKSTIRIGAHNWVESVMTKADKLTVDKPLVQSLINVIKRQRMVADAGDELDFDAWRRGDVDTAWNTTRRVVKEEKRNRAACLFVNLAANCDIHADSMEWRSAAIIKIVQTLSAASWATEIVVGSTTRSAFVNSNERLGITFVAKSSIMPLSIERLVLQTSAAWFRYCNFAAMESNKADLLLHDCYGQADYGSIPPYIARMYSRGYKIIQIPGSSLSQSGAQQAVNNTIREVQS